MALNQQEFDKKYADLPLDIQKAIESVDTASAIETISGKHQLHIDKIGLLTREIGDIMVGTSHPQDFVANLQKRLEVDQATAEAIAKEVNEQIFLPIRESLKKVHHIGATKEELEPAKVEKGYVLKAIEEPEALPMAQRTVVPSVSQESSVESRESTIESQQSSVNSQESKIVGNTQKITIDPYKEQV